MVLLNGSSVRKSANLSDNHAFWNTKHVKMKLPYQHKIV